MSKYIKLAFALLLTLYMLYCAGSPASWHMIDNVDLIFHEAGHTILFFLPDILAVIAGSAFQIVIPIILSLYFFVRKENVSGSVVLSWAGQSIINVSVYAKDAAIMQLPLIGGDSVIHDWNYILSSFHLLKYAQPISFSIYLIGLIIILASIAMCVYFGMKNEPKIEIK